MSECRRWYLVASDGCCSRVWYAIYVCGFGLGMVGVLVVLRVGLRYWDVSSWSSILIILCCNIYKFTVTCNAVAILNHKL